MSWSGIDPQDYPDFCDVYIDSARYDDKEMTDEQLFEFQGQHSQWCYELFMEDYLNG